jgi:Arylsulfotransferase (ASST)
LENERVAGARRLFRALAVVSATALVAGVLLSPAVTYATPSGAKLAISPAPNTPDASPETQISILGVAPDRIRSVHVTGNASGAHTGRLLPYSRHRGASFVLDEPLTQGESASAAVRIRGRQPVRFSFTVANLGPAQPPLNLTATQPSKLDHFTSRPDLIPPRISVNKPSPSTRGDGDILLTPLPSPIVHPESNNAIEIHPVGPGGPMIVDGKGRLVWFKQLETPEVAANLRLQRYEGKDVLTWWQGTVTPSAFGVGEGVIANHSYRTIQTVQAGNGYPMDIHELQLTGTGDALFTIYSPVKVHLPGTPQGTLSPLLDSIVQEVDIRTGLVVWEWHSYGHIPLADSYATPANSASYDAFHVNSIQPLGPDRVLISARDTSAVYKVDRASGRILWTLGGKASSFRLGPGARFYFQHDARILPHRRISLFDDEAGPPMQAPSSRGLVLRLHTHPRRAQVAQQYLRPSDTSAQSEGSVQTLPSGDVFVGWGAQPFFSQFSADGRLLFDASLPQDDGTYRTYRFPWHAAPTTRPTAVARRAGASSVSIFASWNGATEVAQWRILAGGDANSLAPIATARKRGFETRIGVSSSASTFAVEALSSSGRVLATSSPVPAS